MHKVHEKVISEVIDMDNTNYECSPLHSMSTRSNAIGSLLSNQPLVCGGLKNHSDPSQVFQDCSNIANSEKNIQMIEKRYSMAGVKLNETTIWIVGGLDNRGVPLKSTEFINAENMKSTKGPDLPFAISHHCMIRHNGSIYIIGGEKNRDMSEKTWIINGNNSWDWEGPQEGPQEWADILEPRKAHSCEKMILRNGTVIFVIAGGIGKDRNNKEMKLKTTEIKSEENKKWTAGPHLLFGTTKHTSPMLPTPDGRGLLLIGGSASPPDAKQVNHMNVITELKEQSDGQLQWLPTHDGHFPRNEDKLDYVAFYISENLTNCSEISDVTGTPNPVEPGLLKGNTGSGSSKWLWSMFVCAILIIVTCGAVHLFRSKKNVCQNFRRNDYRNSMNESSNALQSVISGGSGRLRLMSMGRDSVTSDVTEVYNLYFELALLDQDLENLPRIEESKIAKGKLLGRLYAN